MAGETFDINYNIETKNKEATERQIMSFVSATYTSWKAAKSQYEGQLLELRNNVFATGTETTASGNLPFSNNIVVPKITQIRDVLHAKYMESLFGISPWFRWTSEDKSSSTAKKANMISSYINVKMEQQKAITVLSQLVRDWIDNGNCYARLIWVNESYTLPSGQVMGYVGPRIYRISHWDIVYNPLSSDFSKTPKIIRTLKSIGELRKMALDSPEFGITNEMIDNLDKKNIGLYGSNAGVGLPDTQKSIGMAADGFSGYMFYQNFRFVEILEFVGDMYINDELLQNHRTVILNRQYVCENKPIDTWVRTDYIYHAAWRTRPDNLIGMGPLDNILGMQYQLNKVTNLKADLLDQYSNPALLTRGEVEVEGPIGMPGQRFTADADADVSYLRPDAGVLQLNTESAQTMALMEAMAIVPPESFGFRQPGEKTLGEVTLMNQGAQNAYNIKVKEFELYFLEPLLNDFLEMSRRNLNGTELVKMNDGSFNTVDFLTITKEDLQAVGKLEAVGSRYAINNLQTLQAINQLSQNPAILNMISPHISRLRMAEVISDLLGLDAYNIVMKDEGIAEDIESQELMAAGQRQMQSAQAAASAPPSRDESVMKDYPQQEPMVEPISSGESVI